jgi:hypothetical protein
MAHSAFGSEAGREGPPVGLEGIPARKLYGLVEIDDAGTVLYTRFEDEAVASFAAQDFTGRNFYTEVAPFRNVAEFRERLDTFVRGSVEAHSMDFTCDYADGPLPVRVVLARIRERLARDVTKSILVHIRRAQ